MAPTVVFDLDKVLLGGDASTLFLHGRLRLAPRRLVPLLLAAPLLAALASTPRLRPLGARVMTRIAVGGRAEDDVHDVAEAYREALTRKPEAAVAEAIAAVRAHQRNGDLVVVATGCEETLARGFVAAIGLGDLDGEAKVELLVERGYPPPWAAVYSDSTSDLPLFAGSPRPVLVNADEKAAATIERTLGRRPETITWR